MKQLLIICTFLFTSITNAQTLLYAITSKNKKLGQLSVVKTTKNNIHHVEINSKVYFKVFIKFNISYKLNSTYHENELIHSEVYSFVNGKSNASFKTIKEGDHYTTTKNKNKKNKINSKIQLSGAMTYFNEPLHNTQMYSDFYGYFQSLETVKPHLYKITNPKNGQISEYYYENGILKTAVIHHYFMTFKLNLIQ